jgi:hypothetical protein
MIPPIVLQLRLDWSFPHGNVTLVTSTLPDAPFGASSLEDVSSRGPFSQRSCTYTGTSTRRTRTSTTRCTRTSTSSSSNRRTSSITGSFLVHWHCSSFR